MLLCCRCPRIAALLIICIVVWFSSIVLTLGLCMCCFVSPCRVHVRSVCLCTWICVPKHFEYADELSFFFSLFSVSWFWFEMYVFFCMMKSQFLARYMNRIRKFISFVIFHTILFSSFRVRLSREPSTFDSAVGLRHV